MESCDANNVLLFSMQMNGINTSWWLEGSQGAGGLQFCRVKEGDFSERLIGVLVRGMLGHRTSSTPPLRFFMATCSR